MVQAPLRTYPKDCISLPGSCWWNAKEVQLELSAKKGGSWFGRYRLLFLDLGIDWEKAPVSDRRAGAAKPYP